MGVIHLKDVVKGGMKERIGQLRAMGIRSVMITGDNPLTAAAIAQEAGVDDFLAQATPADKLNYIRKEQAEGRLVAMTGDGTNDAPALAQADVGLAMNTGTMAAKEAGNMVDLDSNPTKLIEVVAIGKQLLITRGALTTFSIANDVAKYFAIIPAMFMVTYPALGHLNIMRLHSPESAILSAVIFNALIIIALVPLALRGVKYRPQSAAALLRRNLLIYGLGESWRPSPVSGFLTSFSIIFALLRTDTMWTQLAPAFRMTLLFTVLTGLVYPGIVTGFCQVLFPRQANGSLVTVSGHVVGSALLGQNFAKPEYFHPRPSAAGSDGYDASSSGGSNYGPTNQKLIDRVKGDEARFRKDNPQYTEPIPADALTASASGLDPDISPAYAHAQAARVAQARGISVQTAQRLVDSNTKGRELGFLGEPRVNVLALNLAMDRQAPRTGR